MLDDRDRYIYNKDNNDDIQKRIVANRYLDMQKQVAKDQIDRKDLPKFATMIIDKINDDKTVDLKDESENKVEIQELEQGFYLAKISNTENETFSIQKFIKVKN